MKIYQKSANKENDDNNKLAQQRSNSQTEHKKYSIIKLSINSLIETARMRMLKHSTPSTMKIFQHAICVIIIVCGLYLYGANACLSHVSFRSRKPEPVAPAISLLAGDGELLTGTAVPTPAPPTSWSQTVFGRATPPTKAATMRTTMSTTTTTTTTPRPNVSFPTFPCKEEFRMFYCLNAGTCFLAMVDASPLYGCKCATGWGGLRCETKEFDTSFIPRRPSLEEANPEGAVFALLVFIFIICIIAYYGSRPMDLPDYHSKQATKDWTCADDNDCCCHCAAHTLPPPSSPTTAALDWCCCCREIYEKLQNVNKLAKSHYLVKRIRTYARKHNVGL